MQECNLWYILTHAPPHYTIIYAVTCAAARGVLGTCPTKWSPSDPIKPDDGHFARAPLWLRLTVVGGLCYKNGIFTTICRVASTSSLLLRRFAHPHCVIQGQIRNPGLWWRHRTGLLILEAYFWTCHKNSFEAIKRSFYQAHANYRRRFGCLLMNAV